MDVGPGRLHGRQSADVSFSVDVLPPCDGGPDLLSSLTDAQCAHQVYDLLGFVVHFLMQSTERQITLKAERGQLKVGISDMVTMRSPIKGRAIRHRRAIMRTIDPQVSRPVQITPSLCREMGGAALLTIHSAIHEAAQLAKEK